MKSYYNDFDKDCCNVLQRQVSSGNLPDGFVDHRSIADVGPEELNGYNEAHFFAGIGGFPNSRKSLDAIPEDLRIRELPR